MGTKIDAEEKITKFSKHNHYDDVTFSETLVLYFSSNIQFNKTVFHSKNI